VRRAVPAVFAAAPQGETRTNSSRDASAAGKCLPKNTLPAASNNNYGLSGVSKEELHRVIKHELNRNRVARDSIKHVSKRAAKNRRCV
jgi:hypothetical protein